MQVSRTGTTRQAVDPASEAATSGPGAQSTIGTTGQSAARRAAAAKTDTASRSRTASSARSTTSVSGWRARHRSRTSYAWRMVVMSRTPTRRTTVPGDPSWTSQVIRLAIATLVSPALRSLPDTRPFTR
nr:hypothetical protein [Micromonospora tarapacensis]